MMRVIPHHPDRTILGLATLLLATALAAGLYAAPLFWLAMAASVAVGTGFLAYRQPTAFCVAWLLITSASLEMTLNDLVGTEMYQLTIALVKGMEIALAALCALRYGLRGDAFSPIWAYLAMLATGLVHGLYPGLTTADSLRSLIGSAAPFAFCFCRLPPSWPRAMITATKWCPALVVLACVPLDLSGIRPLFVDSGGARLAGLGHPAFLAGVCLPAIYACLIQLYRQGRRGDLWLLAGNLLILVLTGARAPLAYAVAVTGISLVSIRSAVFPPTQRLLLVLAAGAALPVLVLLAGNFSEIRLFNVVANEAANLSGRDLLWPAFEAAAAKSPWFGWGIGAGNLVIPPSGQIAQTLHTWAAHNEYLRMQVEGGQLGRTLLIVLFASWILVHTRYLPAADRRIMRLVFVAFACHAFTDNVLISTPACVLFAFAIAVFARGEAASDRLTLPDSAQVA
ncbi:O-antigen ligase family protein [Rhodopila sp.]|uniref:O-antigen ligase family protein n=1 Tax=Rhodopila sp. TaxID=2480087 RepID=UPI003D0C28C8